jgi:hypothetical protein
MIVKVGEQAKFLQRVSLRGVEGAEEIQDQLRKSGQGQFDYSL